MEVGGARTGRPSRVVVIAAGPGRPADSASNYTYSQLPKSCMFEEMIGL